MHLALATVMLLIVSLSWAIVVDLTPASQRPYVDSSSNNTVMELIIGHNGIERLTNSRTGAGPNGLGAPNQLAGNPPQPPALQDQFAQGQPPQPPSGQNTPLGFGDDGGGPMGGGQPGGSMDFGTAGTLRLFTAPLAGEASWLLPFVLGGLIVLAFVLRKRSFGEEHIALILWGGWLLPEAIYFTYSTGLMHAYYLIMLGAPIAALAGMTIWALWKIIAGRKLFGWAIAALLAAITLFFQAITLWSNTTAAIWIIVIAGVLFSAALLLIAIDKLRGKFIPVTLTILLAAMLVAPATWSTLTTFNASPNSGLPYAGPARQVMSGRPMGPGLANGSNRALQRQTTSMGNMPMPMGPGNGGSNKADQELLDYLLANTKPGTYLLATGRSNSAAPYILETGRPVLTFGGFLGNEDVVTVDQLSELVKSGQLRFVLGEDLNQHQAIAEWVKNNCKQVNIPGMTVSNMSDPGNPGRQPGNTILYDCEG